MTVGVRPVVAALRRSQEELRFVVTPLTSRQLRGPSFRPDRSIAQVLSQLGTGAEIGELVLTAAVEGRRLPGRDTIAAIRRSWRTKSPEQQTWDALRADAALTDLVESFGPVELAKMTAACRPIAVDAAAVVRMWLRDHTTHSWDIAVAVDPTATLDNSVVTELVDCLNTVVGVAGVPSGTRLRLRVSTLAPERELVLTADDTVRLDGWDSADDRASDEPLPHLTLWAESLVRLVYGRFDPMHAPAVQAAGVDLDRVRELFPRFGPLPKWETI